MMDRPSSAWNRRAPAHSRRRASHRLYLEPLEDRRLLVATTYVNDDWQFVPGHGPTLEEGDLVRSTNDAGTIINAEYGYDAFGIVDGQSLSQFATIHSAIEATDANGTLTLLPGTYRKSDIVIDKPMPAPGLRNPPGA